MAGPPTPVTSRRWARTSSVRDVARALAAAGPAVAAPPPAARSSGGLVTSDVRNAVGAPPLVTSGDAQRRSLPWEAPVDRDTQGPQLATLQQIKGRIHRQLIE